MTPTLQWCRALCAAALLLSSISCGPKVVVARLATPTAEAPRAAATPTPPLKPRLALSPRSASPAPTSPRPTATPTATRASTAVAPKPSPTLMSSPAPRASPVTPTAPPRPSPSATATRTPALPSPSPSATPTPSPPPTSAPAPPEARPAVSVSITPSTSSLIGEWDFRADAGQGVIAGTLRFHAEAAGIAGTYAGLRGNTTELSNLRVSGDRLSFDLVTPRVVWHLEGARSGDRINGTFQTAERTIPWSAARKGPPAPALTPSGNPS